MDVTQLTNESLIDTLRAYPDRHPDRGPVIMEMRKRGMLGEDARIEELHKTAAKKGNVKPLQEWYSGGANGKIDWGHKGDFEACVKIASKFMKLDQARGWCNERHQQATGGPPGSEDVKKENPSHVGSGPEGGQFTSQGGAGAGSTDSTSATSSAVIPPPNAYSPTGPIVNYTIANRGKGGGKAPLTGPRFQIPPTPKAPGLSPVHVKGSEPHIAKPKSAGVVKPKNVKGPPPPSAPKEHFGSSGKIKFK